MSLETSSKPRLPFLVGYKYGAKDKRKKLTLLYSNPKQ